MIVEVKLIALDLKILRLVITGFGGIAIEVTDTMNGISMSGKFQEYPNELVDALNASLEGATDSILNNQVVPFGINVHSDHTSHQVVLFFGQHDKIVQLVLSKTDVRFIVLFIDTYLAQ